MKGAKKGKVRTEVRTPLPMSPPFPEVFQPYFTSCSTSPLPHASKLTGEAVKSVDPFPGWSTQPVE